MTTTIATAPQMALRPWDIENLVGELHAYHTIYSPLFQRNEQRQWAAEYRRGVLWDIPRKSIEPMVLTRHGADGNAMRAMQQFASEGAWNDDVILTRHGAEVDQPLGDADGVLTLDGRDVPKQGKASVGVKRQYGGAVGKRAHCQAGVLVGSASAVGSTLLHRRLYLPEEWVTDAACAERRRKCGVPATVGFATKPALGWARIREVVDDGHLRARWVACDEGFGRDTTFFGCGRREWVVVLCRSAPRYAGRAGAPADGGSPLVWARTWPDTRTAVLRAT
jgi:SRSO17 transposase